MNILLKLKHWQLFFISFLLPTIIVIIKLSTVDLESYETEKFNDFLQPLSFIYYVIFFIWNYEVIKTFNRYEKALTPKQLKALDWLLTILIIYVLYNILHEFLGVSQFIITRILFWTFSPISGFAFFIWCFVQQKPLSIFSSMISCVFLI